MQVKILGSGAGGGFPPWNWGFPHWRSLRAGQFHGKAPTQTKAPRRPSFKPWVILGASPDLRAQIELTPDLHPHAADHETRHSPISGVVFLNADIDHVLGLLLLRELQPLNAYASLSVRRILTEDNSMFVMLQ